MEKYFEEMFNDSEFDEKETQKFLVLIIYDIFDNKRRLKLSNFLKGYGNRIQLSAFECYVTNSIYNKLVDNIPKYISSIDLVKIYKLHGSTLIKTFGVDNEPLEDDFIFI